MVRETLTSAEGARTRVVWRHAPPRKFLNVKDLKTLYPALSGRWLSNLFLKLIIFFLNLTKRAFLSAIFSKLIIIVTAFLMLVKYDTSLLQGTKKCTVILIMTCNSEFTWISKLSGQIL